MVRAEPGELADEDLAVFLEMSNEIFGVFDLEQGLVWSNGTAAALLGYDEDEAGRDVARRPHPSRRPRRGPGSCSTNPPVTSSPPGSSPVPVQGRLLALVGVDGPSRARSGLVYGAARDVTDHHVAQSALAANEAWLAAILDHSTAAIFVKDTSERYVVVNEVFLRAFGLDRDDVLGKTVTEIWPDASDRRHRPTGPRRRARSSPGTTSCTSPTAPTP